jgi:DNA/RNA-binding domain of Phe-tRNA-synthetase-like protein
MMLAVESHPTLFLGSFLSVFPEAIGTMSSPDWLTDLLSLEVTSPVTRTEDTRAVIRDLLRHGGYKPTGRGKPASEYLVRAAGERKLTPINPAVDACNVVSLHSGLPVSVIDLDRAASPFRVGLAEADARYVFNASGQEIRVGGLLCLHDAGGPCESAVKDSERTKTRSDTRRTLSLIWGARILSRQVDQALAWYRELVEGVGATTEPVSQEAAGG